MAGEPVTIRLDLRIHPDSLPGRPPKMVRDDLFGCADCDLWWPNADKLVAHLREHARPADE